MSFSAAVERGGRAKTADVRCCHTPSLWSCSASSASAWHSTAVPSTSAVSTRNDSGDSSVRSRSCNVSTSKASGSPTSQLSSSFSFSTWVRARLRARVRVRVRARVRARARARARARV